MRILHLSYSDDSGGSDESGESGDFVDSGELGFDG